MTVTDFILPLLAFLLGLAIMYAYFRLRIGILEEKGRTDLERWKLEHEDKIRKDSLNRSRFTLKGKISGQLAPLFPEFPFAPSGARFIGSPIDFVVFDGYTKAKDGQGDAFRVVLAEVKRGKNAKLTRGERW
jgi:predicted Holliday junction resolvase-like endonuclease